MTGKRRVRVWALLPMMALLGLSGCSAATPDARQKPAKEATEPVPEPAGGMTSAELMHARKLARAEIAKQVDATVDSVTVSAEEGTVLNSNIGYACTSGRLLHIRLIGSFPRVAVSPAPGSDTTPDGPEASRSARMAIDVTADATSGKACLVSVTPGVTEPRDGATDVDWQAPRLPFEEHLGATQ